MKLITAILLTAILAFALGEYLPWWSVAAAAFAASLFIRQGPVAAFAGGFIGVSAMWAAYALWIDQANQSILSERIASLLPLQGQPVLLILFTGLIGGLVGGLAALSANFLVRPKRERHDHQSYYRNKFR